MPKTREIRGLRHVTKGDDGDTIQLKDFQMFRNGEPFVSWAPPAKSLSKGNLKVRMLGIDTPELHYPGPTDKGPNSRTCPNPVRIKIPPQDPFGTQASQWLLDKLPDGARVIVELDLETFDQYRRVLGYVWTVKDDWKRHRLLNAELVKAGLAHPYQHWPNLLNFDRINEAAKKASTKGVIAATINTPLTLDEIRVGQVLNEPFVYRKVIDAAICQKDPMALLGRWVGDARTWLYYKPTQYTTVPIPYRVFFSSESEAVTAGFVKG
jgi:endonuclease YncB( thermonuclease family)